MKNIKTIYFFFLNILIFNSYADHDQKSIQFSDSQFEAQLRSKIEKGSYWMPNYSGRDYIFKSADFASWSYLTFDSDYPAVSSLTDLQHFPMLNRINIWDASKITDFSPIWNLKDQLENLAINGSRNADLSGVAEMSRLRGLDLDDNQLTNLSFLGNYPQLTELYLVGNYLDLSDPGIQATLSNFRTLLQTNRSNMGWWYYSEAVEVEPQMPKSFQNLRAEILRVQNGNDPQSNLLKGIHALLQIVESTEVHSLKEFAVAVGVEPSIRQFTLSELSMLDNYSHTLNRDLNASKLAELMQNSIIPSLEQVDAHFAKIPSGSVIKLSQDLTGTEDEVTVDYADVLVLRSIVNLLSTLASMQSAYDWSANAGFLDDLDENPDPAIEITAESLRAHNSNFGGIRDAGQLVKAKNFLDNVIAYYGQASPLLRESSRLNTSMVNGQPSPDRLFVLSSQDLDEEREFRDALDELSKAINGTYELKDDDWGLNALLALGGVPSTGTSFTVQSKNGETSRDVTIKFISYYWGWEGAELIIRDSNSRIIYNGTLSGANESKEILSLPTNQTYTVGVLEGSNSWSTNSKFWEIHYYDSVVHSEDDDLVAEKENFDLSQFFKGKLDLANLLPSNNGNNFSTDRFTDPTMGGILPDWTQRRLSEELYSEELIKMKPMYNGTISNNGLQTFFVKEDGSLWGMGDNVDGALGTGKSGVTSDYIPNKGYSLYDSNVDHATPFQIERSGVKSVVAGKYHTIFLKQDGSLWGMGYNATGALGNGKAENDYRDQDADGTREALEASPVRIVNAEVVNIAVSDFETWFVKENGSLWKMGGNDLLPKMILPSGVVQVELITYMSNFTEAFALDSNGTVTYIYLDANNIQNSSVIMNNGVKSISAGNGHLLILKWDGSLWVAGQNNYGQLGNGQDKRNIPNFVPYNQPMKILSVDNIASISGGFEHSLLVKEDGSFWGMGDNWKGELGINKNESTYSELDETGSPYALENVPVQILSSGVAQISAGLSSSIFVKTDGSLWGMGWNISGQLGQGTFGTDDPRFEENVDHDTPIQILRSGMSASGITVDNNFDNGTDTDGDGLTDAQEILYGTSITKSDSDNDGLPDKVEVDAGLNPTVNDSLIIQTTKQYFYTPSSNELNASRTTPYTHDWYYQSGMGWMWTNSNSYPYIFKSGTGGQPGSWMFFSEQTANPIRMYDYSSQRWITLGN
jgi:alpha-tubulin suppressor-like RCC1 family protein